jgi:hypothetical protein
VTQSNLLSRGRAGRTIRSWAQNQADAYRSQTDDPRPLAGYVRALTTYGATVTAITALARVTGHSAPQRVTPWDVMLTGLATHKLSRIIAKDSVTTPLRAPFTVYDQPQGDAEVHEQVREHGNWKHAVGELLTCPFCLAQWIATGFATGYVFAPGFTRLAAAVLASVGVSDFLQVGYAGLQKVCE